MADFDPFANQGGAAAWDPEHAGDSKKQADELLRRLAADDGDPGSGPSTFSEGGEDAAAEDAADVNFQDADAGQVDEDAGIGDYAEDSDTGGDGTEY